MHSSACVTDCFGSGTVGCTLVSQEGCEAAPGLPGKRGNALIPLGWTQNKQSHVHGLGWLLMRRCDQMRRAESRADQAIHYRRFMSSDGIRSAQNNGCHLPIKPHINEEGDS